jgi:predicted CoA-binding protein
MKVADAALEFLSRRRIAVAGVSHTESASANAIYRRLRSAGYLVFAVNPKADVVEGDRCYHRLAEIEGDIDGVVVVTHPRDTLSVVQDCAALGIDRVWFHRSFGSGSVSSEAVQFCRDHGIAVIDGACPMMFLDPVDTGHKCMRWLLGVTHKLPDGSNYQALQRTH